MAISSSSESSFEPESTNAVDEWEGAVAALRRRYPDASNGILFCVHKLQQDPTLTLRDFRKEAELHGVSVGGRSLHSARVLLGYEKPARPRRSRSDDAAEPEPLVEGSLEDQVISAVTQIQQAATEQSQRLRAAIREAIQVLRRALDD